MNERKVHYFLLYFNLKLFVILFLSSIAFYSCTSTDTTPIDLFVPCDKHADDIKVKYFDNVLNEGELVQFMNGTWRLNRVEAIREDSLLVAMPSLERELRFIDNRIEVYEPYGNLLGSSEYSLIGVDSGGGELFRIEQLTSINDSYYLLGTIIPCNSEMVFFLSDIDLGDRFYRKVE